ncbi:MAG: hypothetical protein O4859_02810, partial [Trichodesmium sp. St18_bin1]|nr:hypothetical protein [Trichodesmium sp. St18_bin1]
ISVYQDELMRLQDYSRRKNGKNILKKNMNSDNLSVKDYEEMEIQQALPDPFADALTGEV